MLTCEQTICPRCFFPNSSSRKKCEICDYPLDAVFDLNIVTTDKLPSKKVIKSKIYSLYQNKKKATNSTSVVVNFLIVAALVVGSVGSGTIILNYFTSSLFLTRDKILNKTGDIKLYDTKSDL